MLLWLVWRSNMHFFYLDEAGDTGTNLSEQPIFVLGGLSVSDEKWKTLEDSFRKLLQDFLGENWNDDFELHSEKMRNRQGVWEQFTFDQLNALTHDILDLVISNGHKIHFFAINKQIMQSESIENYPYDINPYFFAYEYILNYSTNYIKNILGKSARGIFIIDEKKGENGTNVYYETIRKITDNCRYSVPKTYRLKRIVEFTYPIDSKKNSMIQISDLIVYCIKKYFEYKLNFITPNEIAKSFYKSCFEKIYRNAIWRKTFVDCTMCLARNKKPLNTYLKKIGVFK